MFYFYKKIILITSYKIVNFSQMYSAQWHTVFYVSAGAYFMCNLIFIIFGEAEVQPWNQPEKSNTCSKENGLLYSFMRTFDRICCFRRIGKKWNPNTNYVKIKFDVRVNLYVSFLQGAKRSFTFTNQSIFIQIWN